MSLKCAQKSVGGEIYRATEFFVSVRRKSRAIITGNQQQINGEIGGANGDDDNVIVVAIYAHLRPSPKMLRDSPLILHRLVDAINLIAA